MVDIRGESLNIGDKVIHFRSDGEMVRATITRVTLTRVTISYTQYNRVSSVTPERIVKL